MKHRIGGATYSVPQVNDFTVYSCGLSRWFGCPDDEPENSLWLIFPAREIAQAIPGYRAVTRGYVSDVQVDLVAHVSGGQAFRDFGKDYERLWRTFSDTTGTGNSTPWEPATGWVRILKSEGAKGTDGEGFSNFYLVPEGGQKALPPDWGPPSCLASPDQNQVQYYHCHFLIRHEGKIFEFSLPEENLAFADRIPAYVLGRLGKWRQS